MAYTIEQIEDALIAAIEASAMAAYCKTIESYAGQLEADISTMIKKFPAVFVMYSGGKARMLTGIEYEKSLGFTFFVVAKNLRGNIQARKDDYGTYQMLKDLETLLVDNQLGLEIEPIAQVSEEPVMNTKQFSIYAAEYSTVFVAAE